MVLLALLLVVGGIGWAVNTLLLTGDEPAAAGAESGGSAQPGDTEGGQPTTDAATQAAEADDVDSPAPEVAEEPGQVGPCTAGALAVDTAVEPPAPAAGTPVSFTLLVRNEGQVPCLLDAGPGNLVVAVASGSDPVWSSAHCAESGSEVLLDVGSEYTVPVRWSGHRSSQGCPGGQPVAGAGTYRATAALGGAALTPASPIVFSLS